MSLMVLCPTRGRPDKAREAYQSFLVNSASGHSKMVFVLDEDEERLTDYQHLPHILVPRGRPGMTDALNAAIEKFWDGYQVIGFIGDDHRFRTHGWDTRFEDHLTRVGGGFAYGNDGNWQYGEIPTQIFISSSILRALGWMALPAAQHLYLDNTWRVLGEGAHCLYYFPDVLIELMHPAFGKAQWDEGYRLVNAQEMYSHDGQAFDAWLKSGAEDDISKVRAVVA